jgi:hypothetical protein
VKKSEIPKCAGTTDKSISNGEDCRVLQILLKIALKLQIGKDYGKKE